MGAMTDIAIQLREEFDKRAVEADPTATLPERNYQEMADAGYLRALVPAELGGLGADLPEFARAQRALGWGCASTALAVNMHHFQIGAASEGFRASGKNEAFLRRVAAEEIVLGSTAAEAVVAGAWDTETTAVGDGDEYHPVGPQVLLQPVASGRHRPGQRSRPQHRRDPGGRSADELARRQPPAARPDHIEKDEHPPSTGPGPPTDLVRPAVAGDGDHRKNRWYNVVVDLGSARGQAMVTSHVEPETTRQQPFAVLGKISLATTLAVSVVAIATVVGSSVVAWDGTVPGWEESVLRFFNEWPDWLEPPTWVLQQVGVIGAPVIAGLIVVYFTRRWIYLLPFLTILPLKLGIEKAIVKQLVERERPFVSVGDDIIVRGPAFEGLSFPSGHATTAVALSIVLFAFLPKRWRLIPVVWAVIVGVVRLYFGEHNFLDVVAGTAMGTLFGVVIWFLLMNRHVQEDTREEPTAEAEP